MRLLGCRWAGGGGYSRMTAEGAASLRRILLETIDGTMPDKVSLALPAVMAVFEEIVRNGKEWQDLRQVCGTLRNLFRSHHPGTLCGGPTGFGSLGH